MGKPKNEEQEIHRANPMKLSKHKNHRETTRGETENPGTRPRTEGRVSQKKLFQLLQPERNLNLDEKPRTNHNQNIGVLPMFVGWENLDI